MEKRITKRMANWDLLRSISMFAVLVVHTAPYLGNFFGINFSGIVSVFSIVCDPVFFALSGYFAIRPLKCSSLSYYLKKFTTIVLPLFVYAVFLCLLVTPVQDLTLKGYIQFFSGLLTSEWWFIPTLIPFLIIAPFLHTLFESLSDRRIIQLSKLILILTAWGICSTFLMWAASETNHPTISSTINSLRLIIPVSLIPNSYFIYFCLGYFFRRINPLISRSQKQKLILLGISAWIVDGLFSYYGVPRIDPSLHWMFVTIALFVLFDSLTIQSDKLQQIFSWTAQRSYSIYLLNFTAINTVMPRIYEKIAVSFLPGASRLVIWLAGLLTSYLLALTVASIIDKSVLAMAQKASRFANKKILTKIESSSN